MVAIFPGSIHEKRPQDVTSGPRVLCVQDRDSCNWTALDYDEVRGRIALGMSDGNVMLLEL